MAIRCNGSFIINNNPASLPAVDPLTVMFFVYLDANTAAWTQFLEVQDASFNVLYSLGSANGTTLHIFSAIGGSLAGSVLSTGTWYHIAYVRSGTSHTVYLNGVSDITGTYNQTGTPNILYFGLSVNGRVASLKVFTAALTQVEVQNEGKVLGQVRSQNLHFFTPALTVSDLMDYAYGSDQWSLSTTPPTTADFGPPFPWSRGRSTHIFLAPIIYQQEGYRWRNDDGSEITATWVHSQDSNVTAPVGATRRLRVLIDRTG